MAKIVLPGEIEFGETSSGAKIMSLLDAIRTGGNAMDDENVGAAGIREVRANGQIVIVWSTTAGHRHDGSDAREIVTPTLTRRGALRHGLFTASLAPDTWSSELLAGAIPTIVGAWLLHSNSVAVGSNDTTEHLELLPPGFGGAATDLYSDRAIDTDFGAGEGALYVALDLLTAPNRAWVRNQRNAVTENVRLLVLGY